mgnify:CR=1 FL=1
MTDVSRSIRPIFSLLVLLACSLAVQAVAQESDESASPEAAADVPRVAEAAVCVGVEDRAPVGAAESFPADTERLYCFTDVRDAGGSTVVHAWIHEGTTRARVELEVGGDRWRTWSTKQILPDWTGSWQVKVMTADGAVLETLDFTVE